MKKIVSIVLCLIIVFFTSSQYYPNRIDRKKYSTLIIQYSIPTPLVDKHAGDDF